MGSLMLPLYESPNVELRLLFMSFFTDGTFTIIVLVLNSVGLYNIVSSRPKYSFLLILIGMILLMINSIILFNVKFPIIIKGGLAYEENLPVHIVSVLVSLIWFATIEFLTELNKFKEKL